MMIAGPGVRLTAAEPVRLQLQWQPQAQFAGYMVAKARGFFAKAGLEDVRLLWATDGSRTLDRVAQGKTDFCTSWLSDGIVERAGGLPRPITMLCHNALEHLILNELDVADRPVIERCAEREAVFALSS